MAQVPFQLFCDVNKVQQLSCRSGNDRERVSVISGSSTPVLFLGPLEEIHCLMMAAFAPSSALINLCDPVFKTVVTCDTVTSEGYEVTNLLSDDVQKRKAGFLCDRFIKAPVEITLKFPFDANIRYIQIGAEVGQQKSSGLDIFSSSVPYNSSLCSGSSEFKHQSKSSLALSPIVERIASVVLNEAERGAVLFCPLQYGRHSPTPVPNTKAGFIQRSLMWKKRSVIAHTSAITVRIFRTFGSSVPAISSIEIWGGPSTCIPASQVSDIMSQWTSAHQKQALESGHVDEIFKEVVPVLPRKPDLSMLSDIPEEFLDAITVEIMALPMVLPSGKVVDQRTLDLHAQAEANWGRHPSDPFTGIMFSDGCRPVIDSALKARIDRFLVLNQDRKDLKSVPRTVGRAQPQICHQSVSRFRSNRVCFDLASNIRKRPAVASSTSVLLLGETSANVYHSQPRGGQNENLSGSIGPNNKTNSEKQSSVTSTVSKKPKLIASSTSTVDDICEDDIICITPCEQTKPADDLKTHEKKLDDSLDSALKAALSGLPSFVNPSTPKTVPMECGSCKAFSSLYRLPCEHFLCRPCLVRESKQKPSTCQSCNFEFKSCDPVFHHE